MKLTCQECKKKQNKCDCKRIAFIHRMEEKRRHSFLENLREKFQKKQLFEETKWKK